MGDDPRPGSRGARSTRRGHGQSASAAADHAQEGGGADGDDAGEEQPGWKVELESIMAGTHPTLVEMLEPHEQKKQKLISQADRVRQLQISNINALFECEKKQVEDENKAQLEFFRSRLIDTIEEKQKKATRQMGTRANEAEAEAKVPAPGEKRKRNVSSSVGPLPAAYSLKPDELKADLEEILANVDHYSVRSAAAASDELRGTSSAEAWFDRSRQMLHCSGQSYERGSNVFVYMQGQRVDEVWTLTAMNAVEVTLREADGTKLKVTLAQLRNGRYGFRPAPSGH